MLIRIGLFKATSITVIAAVATAFFACMQWLIYTKQCEVMRDQHDAMEQQIVLARKQLELAGRAAEQTDKQLDFTWMQLRPWLTVTGPSLNQPFVAGENLKFTLPVHNTGNSPGIITQHLLNRFTLPANMDHNLITQTFTLPPGGDRKHRTIVPAQRHIEVNLTLNGLAQSEIDLIESGVQKLYILGLLAYEDARGTSDIAECNYFWDKDSSRLILAGE